MSFDYESGVLAALVVVLVRDAYLLSLRLSILYVNMAQIGLRQSFVTGRWKRGGSLLWEVPVSLLFSAVTVALSWVGVAYQAVVISYQFFKRLGAPREIKDLQWRLRNALLPARAVAELHVRLMELVLGRDAAPAERNKAVTRVLEAASYDDDDPCIVFVPDYDGTLVVADRDEYGIYRVRGYPVGSGTPPPPPATTVDADDEVDPDIDEDGMRRVDQPRGPRIRARARDLLRAGGENFEAESTRLTTKPLTPSWSDAVTFAIIGVLALVVAGGVAVAMKAEKHPSDTAQMIFVTALVFGGISLIIAACQAVVVWLRQP